MITQAGKYTGQIADYGLDTTKDGKPVFVVHFNIEGFGSLKWRGFLTEKTMENTFKTLALLGFNGNDPQVIGDGPITGALDMKQDYSLVVNMKPGFKDASKSFPEIRFINRVNEGHTVDAAVVADAKTKVSALAGMWLKVKGQNQIHAKVQVPNLDTDAW